MIAFNHEKRQKACPPIGLRPRWFMDEMRLDEICGAIARYGLANPSMRVPTEWIDELQEITTRLRERRA